MTNISNGTIPAVNTHLTFADRTGAWKARWGIGRMHYTVRPGLYAVGMPDSESPVLVTANYKLTFDTLRKQLVNRKLWILVLDTHGINVWCAAGKGTFGTDEVVKRIESVNLSEVVSHRKIVVPQLGASGVSAHEVQRRCGFKVIYGPVRAADVPAFLDAGMKVTPDMRRVRFTIKDRAVLIPFELVMGLKYALILIAGFLILSGLGKDFYSIERVYRSGIHNGLFLLAGLISGVVFTPLLLPWLPGRAFSLKGVWIGMVFLAMCQWLFPGTPGNNLSLTAWFCIMPAVTSFTAMNFTGATTFTSLSGVKKEVKIAVPIQALVFSAGLTLWLVSLFL